MDCLDQLMLAIHQGCEEALCQLMNSQRHRLEGLAQRLLDDRPAAEDVVQEAFLAIWQTRDRYAPGKPAWPWVARIVRNGCHQRWRRRGGRRKRSKATEVAIELAEGVVARSESPPDQAQQSELVGLARKSIASLPAAWREVVQLSVFGEMADGDMAALLGVPLGTIKSRKHRAFEALRDKLRDHQGDIE